MPQSHVDLPRFDLLAWGSVDVKTHWHLDRGDDHAIVAFRPRLICNDLMLLRQSVLSGLGASPRCPPLSASATWPRGAWSRCCPAGGRRARASSRSSRSIR